MADPALPPQHQPTLEQPSDTQPVDRGLLDIETLVADHGPVLYRYSYRLTGSAADAEDLTQQVFLTALTKLDQLRDPGAARAWLCSVLRRAYLRGQRKPRPLPVANLDVDVNLLAADAPDELDIDGEELQRVVNELPEEFKLVLVGFYFEDCSYKELAERLELPIGTVMSRLSRAKGYLRTQLLRPESTGEPNKQPTAAGNGEPGCGRHEDDRVRGKAR